MVGTVRAARNRGRTGAAFAAGLALGAAAVFVALGAIGAAVSGHAVVLAALAIGAVAVASDALGLRVRPQIHYQVPEPWRCELPLPRALFLYGLLLGTCLTTYVPATAAWALPALSLALGDVRLSLAIALAFAAGRALPVLVLAARGDETVLAERPRGQRLLRVLVAASLLLALLAGTVRAAGTVASPAADSSVEGADVAWQADDGDHATAYCSWDDGDIVWIYLVNADFTEFGFAKASHLDQDTGDRNHCSAPIV